ncbi:hypothetical protein SAMN04488581_2662 [Mycolicibacterium neoaurum]|uniref:hypothetical protein n=1 Tax=Mycolicibacterium neoaurum TaxID=1795 RepID=UPI000564D16E|nr:hypothetical protein [Mycolicibacterium neoaurum]SDD61197.1 hypothetical protein SAMN04488581_2662 [Mycolicibacterium neoaurum]
MNDPAVEAADRAWANRNVGDIRIGVHMTNAAREALRPIREFIEVNTGLTRMTDDLLDLLAPLVYSSEELS